MSCSDWIRIHLRIAGERSDCVCLCAAAAPTDDDDQIALSAFELALF